MKVTIKDVERIIRNKDFSRLEKRKFLYNLFKEKQNFFVFCKTVLPKAFVKPSPPFHYEVMDEFMDLLKNSALAAPRGFAKSTLIGQGFLLWLIAYKLKKYIVYGSENHQKTVQFLEPLTHEIKYNPMYRFIYGAFDLAKTFDNKTNKDREDVFDVNGVRIQAFSFEKNIRGLKYMNQRPDLILLDDIENDERVLNPLLREKDRNKIDKQILPSRDAETGAVKMIGTILHHDSQLVRRIAKWNGKVYKAHGPNYSNLLWPELWPKEKLMEFRKDMGPAAYQSEFLNNPVDDTFSLIKKKWMKACCDTTMSYGGIEKYRDKFQGVDFAFSDAVTADKSAFVTVGVQSLGYDVVDCVTKKGMSVTAQFDYIEYFSGINKITDNALEENSIRSMSNELRKYKFEYSLFWTGAVDAAYKPQADKEFENKRHTVGKRGMITRLGTQFENGRIRLPYKTSKDQEITNQLMDECATYALRDGKLVETGVHGDIPIALGYAIERAEMEKFIFDCGSVDMNPDDEDDDEDEEDYCEVCTNLEDDCTCED